MRKGTLGDVSGHYDLVLFCHVLEHLQNPLVDLILAKHRLREGGHIFIAVPHAGSPWSSAYDSHLWMFDEHTLPRIAAEACLKVKDMFKINFRRDCEELWALLR